MKSHLFLLFFFLQFFLKTIPAQCFPNLNTLDPDHQIPKKALDQALEFWKKNISVFENKKYLSIINFAQSSLEKRFYIINMFSGKVWAIHTAHGRGSDPNKLGRASSFSNSPGSNASSLGYFRTRETYMGKHGLSLRLDGLSGSNSEALSRSLVIHGADYVKEENIMQGRSFGCPAIAMDIYKDVINELKDGSLIFATYEPDTEKN